MTVPMVRAKAELSRRLPIPTGNDSASPQAGQGNICWKNGRRLRGKEWD